MGKPEPFHRRFRGPCFTSLFAGFVTPGLEELLFWPKLTAPIARKLFYLPLLLNILYHIDSVIVIVNTESRKVQAFLIVLLVGAWALHVRILSCRNPFLKECVDIWNIYFNNGNAVVNDKEQMILKMSRRINKFEMIEMFVLVFQSLIFLPIALIMKNILVPTSLPGDKDEFWIIFYINVLQVSYTSLFGITWVGYQWLTLIMINLFAIEFRCMRVRLASIFNRISYYDNLVSFIPVDNHPEELKCWIHDHCRLIRVGKLMQFIYSLPILFHYLFIIIYSVSYVVSMESTELTDSLKRGTLVWTIISSVTLCLLCEGGQNLLDESIQVASDALGKPWSMYPLSVKRSLLIILHQSQKPVQISIRGLYPLHLKTFYQVMSIAYSFISFVAGTTRR